MAIRYTGLTSRQLGVLAGVPLAEWATPDKISDDRSVHAYLRRLARVGLVERRKSCQCHDSFCRCRAWGSYRLTAAGLNLVRQAASPSAPANETLAALQDLRESVVGAVALMTAIAPAITRDVCARLESSLARLDRALTKTA